ncbi:MAG: YgeY family selenium metabolism-linked hydrolase [Candidatus Thermofonsia Clade 1 bacterium]|uniref:YgeY family selenium metabolism-linked hydrolase n=1 Tax=Candidatus Thermofonsia Clade 1 bacterium TaxID=2364210 RepID=A0A2M8PAN1_9CHLR|nr:MAG: YgeY family selenium metabolism-linked hydrolase [Candidatus Thermofonsia Clade 1 bacterium]
MATAQSLAEIGAAIKARVATQREAIVQFLRELCAIPSYDSQIKAVCERAAAEMLALGFDEVFFDRMGNIVGRIGTGARKLLYDSHLDTVGIGDPSSWAWDPFMGKIEDGVLYARGACDEKGSTPGMIYGMAIARDLGLLEGYTAYYFGNMEEWCDGIAPHALVEVEGIRPDFVVIGEPTRMQVYRGHKGRVEMRVVAKGRSAHAASNHLGDNAIYKLLPIIERISQMEPELGDDPFLGHGKITVSDMKVSTASINAVPDEAIIYIDRRMTFGETPELVLNQLRAVIGERTDMTLELLHYAEPSYTGFVFPVEKIFPAWALSEVHPLVQAGQAALAALNGSAPPTGKWNFSTNGTYWMGKAGIPSIGFGPGDEIHAHTTLDQVRLDDVVDATAFYALLPAALNAQGDSA